MLEQREGIPDTSNQAYADFIERYPQYTTTSSLDDLREKEFARLDAQEHVYLDYTGGGLYCESQLKKHMEMLQTGVFGNPHSNNPTSSAMTELVESAREHVLNYFNISHDEYVVIFTQNASGALKLVGEAYPFAPGAEYVLTFDNHNSVNGIREYAARKGAKVTYIPVVPPDLRIDAERLRETLENGEADAPKLFAYPAQSNFSGVQHSLEWIEYAQSKGWHVLLDCAAFAPTNRLDLSQWHPDFAVFSFYKIFGYPTGLGCLIARREVLPHLRRPWFAGGTITFASVQGGGYFLNEDEEGFEDGTVNYLSIPAVEIGLRTMEEVGIENVHERVMCLTGWLLEQLQALRHNNDLPLIRVYGPTNTQERGGTIAVNLYDPNGKLIDFRRIEEIANSYNISLRSGCFCNPGASEVAHGLSQQQMSECFIDKERMSYYQFLDVVAQLDNQSAGSLRISFGMASNFEDAWHFLEFISGFLNKTVAEINQGI